MKRLPAFLAASLFATLPLCAVDNDPAPTAPATPAPAPEAPADASLPPLAPPDKDKDRLELMPSKPAQVIPPPVDLPLIPEIPSTPERAPKHGADSPIKKRDTTAAAEEDLKLRVRLREARTKALHDPAVQAEWDRSEAAKTEPEKRAALQSYYKLLYGRMTKLDPTLKPHTDKLLQQALVLVTDHLAPAPTPTPAPSATNGPRVKR